MRHAVILAGGGGTRLWPASRRAHPKQFLALTEDDEPMVAAAVRLGQQLVTADPDSGPGPALARVLIVTAESQRVATIKAMSAAGMATWSDSKSRSTFRLLTEPVGRNTAAAIGLAAAEIAESDPDAVIIVLPADQSIRDKPGMVRVLERACEAVAASDAIATIGIVPTRAETGFGYLEVAQAGKFEPGAVTLVRRFVEKPTAVLAESFVASGRYLWNAGIFCMTARRLLAELDVHLPETGRAVREIARMPDRAGSLERVAALYAALPSISIDHAVMEKVSGVVTVPADVGWDDVGSWAALPAMRGVDADRNTIVGQAVILEGADNVIVSDDDTVIAMVGLSDLVVVKSGNAILVMRRHQAQDVRMVVDALTARGLGEYL